VTHDDTVVTPLDGILKGVIRGKVLELAGRQFKTAERSVTLEEIWNAKEAFITSTTKHLVPVVELDGRRIGDGAAGRVTRWISEGLGNLVRGVI
jgi:branched-subunit amino acid aminotransferase/4-amino-4-deoxychorismate lyase